MNEKSSIKAKVARYKQILKNTQDYRKAWNDGLKDMIVSTLDSIAKEADIPAEVEVQDKMENLEIVIFNLGMQKSGMSEKVNEGLKKPMIKSNGGLIYQQLFNGKILIMIAMPFIEGYGEPRPPKTIEILRPEELKQPFIYRHVETFLKDVTEWEDYDDDLPQQNATLNPIGFVKPLDLDPD